VTAGFRLEPIPPRTHSERHRVCTRCGVEYCDITRRMLSRTCSDSCQHAMMADTRRRNGSFVRSPETNAKASASLKGRRHPPEVIERIRLKNLGKKRGPKPDHWSKTAEGRAKMSALHKGRVFTEEHRRNLRLSQARFFAENPEHCFSRGKGGFREDLGRYFRSRWEANYARYLNLLGLEWEYEPCQVLLSDSSSYTPDFVVGGEVHEVKGWMTEKGQRKIDAFLAEYPEAKFRLVGVQEYDLIEREHGDTIPGWEKKR
jgi:hypothetical protein